MPELSDFSVILDGDKTIRPAQGLDADFNTGGRNRGDRKAVLIVNLRSLGESQDVAVKINQHTVGYLYNYFDEDSRNWHSQQIVFSGDVLRDGDNHLEIDVASGDLHIKDIVCWFKQNT